MRTDSLLSLRTAALGELYAGPAWVRLDVDSSLVRRVRAINHELADRERIRVETLQLHSRRRAVFARVVFGDAFEVAGDLADVDSVTIQAP